MMDSKWKHLFQVARETCPYYAELYRFVFEPKSLEDLPLIDHTKYWQQSRVDSRSVMTGPQIDGVVMKTGGTTCRPNMTSYSQIELQRVANHLAEGIVAAGIGPGARIGNLFYTGDLYGSFLLHALSIMSLPMPVVHVPIGGLTAVDNMVELIEQCGVTALLSTTSSMVKISAYVVSQKRRLLNVKHILFGGEPLFKEQQSVILEAFPNAMINGCIYGTIDAGALGVAASDHDMNVYRGLEHSTVIEILRPDGTCKPVEEGEAGIVVATNLTRYISPIIRYPTGDKAVWIDKSTQTFRLLGRVGHVVSLGPFSIDTSDIKDIVTTALADNTSVKGIQSVISRNDGKDQLECLIAASPHDEKAAAGAVTAELHRQRPMFDQQVKFDHVAPLVIRFVDEKELSCTPGSQKLIEIVEKRF